MADRTESEINRRGFLKAVALTAVAATATGGGAALFKQAQQAAAPVITTAPLTAVTISPTASSLATDHLAQLAAAQAEIVRLQAALDAANRQLTAVNEQGNNSLAANQTMQQELASANERVGLLAGLVALYEQLDEVDLDEMVDSGLTAVSQALDGFFADVPSLEESLSTGTLALAQVESHLPVLANGRVWLDGHLQKLQNYFGQIENLLYDVVEVAGPFLQMVNDWFAGIKKWLPFGMGQTAVTVMESITTLLIETPSTIAGLNSNLAQPLDLWLARDEQNEIGLNQTLVKPLRDGVIGQTNKALGKAREVETSYLTNLQAPWHTAVAQKQSVRALIEAYRQEHQI